MRGGVAGVLFLAAALLFTFTTASCSDDGGGSSGTPPVAGGNDSSGNDDSGKQEQAATLAGTWSSSGASASFTETGATLVVNGETLFKDKPYTPNGDGTYTVTVPTEETGGDGTPQTKTITYTIKPGADGSLVVTSNEEGAEETPVVSFTNDDKGKVIFTVRFDANGGQGQMQPMTVTRGTGQAIAANAFAKNGYSFAGWTLAADGASSYADEAEADSLEAEAGAILTLYAVWIPEGSYAITYNLNGGTNGDNPAYYTVETETFALKPATKEGYAFAGWFDNENFSGTPLTKIEKGRTGSITLFAKWERYAITYNLNGGTNGSNPAYYTVETETFALEPATRNNYTFCGWFEAEDFSGSALTKIEKGRTGDIRLWAKWEAERYEITYNLNGGTNGGNPAYYTVETGNFALEPATKEGCTFIGWFEAEDFSGSRLAKIERGRTGSIRLWAKWIETLELTKENAEQILGSGYKSMSTVVIPEGVTAISYELFKDGYCTRVTIPDSVTSIGAAAFQGCKELKRVTIGGSVASIGGAAFQFCRELESVMIPASVTSIGRGAFESCTSLKSVTIPNSITSIAAFRGCTSLESIEIPEGITSIGFEAFNLCTSLKNITIPASVTSIGMYAFKGCTSLESIAIPASVTSIGDSAFQNCTFESIAIPASVTSIGKSAFSGCTSLESIAIPASVTSIAEETFKDCTKLKSVEIPASVTSIGKSAFSGCTSLESIAIPASVISIGEEAFKGCTKLESVEIPASVTSIGKSAFYNCKSVTVLAEKPPYLGDPNFSSTFTKIYVPAGSVEAYKAADGWKNHKTYIKPIP